MRKPILLSDYILHMKAANRQILDKLSSLDGVKASFTADFLLLNPDGDVAVFIAEAKNDGSSRLWQADQLLCEATSRHAALAQSFELLRQLEQAKGQAVCNYDQFVLCGKDLPPGQVYQVYCLDRSALISLIAETESSYPISSYKPGSYSFQYLLETCEAD